MKTSSPEQPKPPDPLSILLIGPPGGGKTTLALQFPSVCVIDIDSFLDGPSRFIRTKDAKLAFSYDPVLKDDEGNVLGLEKGYDRLIEKTDLLIKDKTFKTIIFDSLTMLDEIIAAKIMHDQKRNTLEFRDYDTLRSCLLRVLVSKTRHLNRTVIYIVHEKDKEETDPRNVMNKIVTAHEPTVRGSVGKALGGFFSDVWRCSSSSLGNTVEYRVDVNKTSKDTDLKNSVGFPVEGFKTKHGELMFDKIKPYLNGKI